MSKKVPEFLAKRGEEVAEVG